GAAASSRTVHARRAVRHGGCSLNVSPSRQRMRPHVEERRKIDASGEQQKMAILHTAKHPFGGPGIVPRWTQSMKDAVGTAYSAGSRVWFTVSAGVLSEAYYPTID